MSYDGPLEAGIPFCQSGTPSCDADYDFPRAPYRSTVRFAARRRLGRGRLTFRARFSGNRALLARQARARHARAG